MPRVLIKEGPGRGDTLKLSEGETSIGRGAENAIRLPDRTVSRFHARIFCERGKWFASDLGSRNGTMVNGELVQREELKHMDEIRLGNVVLVFLEDESTDMEALVQSEEDEPEATEVVAVEDLEALRRAAARHREGTATQRLVSLLELSRAAGKVKSLSTLFDRLTATLKGALEPDRVVPIVQERDGKLLPYVRGKSGFDKDLKGIGISAATVERCRRERVAVLSHGSSCSGGKGRKRVRITSVACAPMSIGSQVLGVVYCDRVRRQERFNRDDLEYLCLVAAQMALAIENIRSYERVAARARNLEREVRGQFNLVGRSPQMQQVFAFIRKAAPTNASVLICGQSGTGKELVARAIHYNSRFRDGPFEAVNCAALNPNLVESELFGHIEGAFTGAVSDRLGRFELADGGSIFLDEVGDLPRECQTKLLRVLEEGCIRRVGDVKDRPVNVRVIAASNRDLEAAMRSGAFREDLYYRLDVLRINLPTLRERQGDIEALAEYFLEDFGRHCGRVLKGFHPEVIDIFKRYDWPGNVRELKNVVERMVIMSDGDVLGPDVLPEEIKKRIPAQAPAPEERKPSQLLSLRDMEKDYILNILRSTGGNKKLAAQILGVDRTTLYAKLKRYGLEL